MKNLVIFFSVLFVLSFVFSSCQEEIFEQELETSEIIIKMSLPGDDEGELKSALVKDTIRNDDTIDIVNLKMMNIIFTAEDQNGKSIRGNWNIDLIDSDNDTENQRLLERPSVLFQATNIASIKPSELGLYRVLFHGKGKDFQFYLKHSGIPGDIGDDIQNEPAFRMEKKSIYDSSDDGKTKTAYTLYLKVNENEFKDWSPANGVRPDNKNLWQALVFCGGDNFFPSGSTTYNAKNFKLREAKYSKAIYYDNESYYCFTFFSEDTPPADRFGGGKSYQVQFYVGEYGITWWTFSSNYESLWTKGVWSIFEFMIF